ncbi:MAG TPA: bifunctional phosphoglucose/phosphomannose isomerase [Dehalococcoidia bacterium]|nr:bifunctional phosphoglucose/phosphomannose isomerase [Dehalococcoidia bacterium]
MNGISLDDAALVRKLDVTGLLGRIEALPEQCRDAWEQGRALELSRAFGRVDNVIVCGMGGSAIGGDVARALASRLCHVPVIVHRSYDLPAWVGSRTLAIFCSASGNTEETLAAFDRALDTDAPKIVITQGGRLLEEARANGVATVEYRYDGEPRSGLGYGLMLLLAALRRTGLLEDIEEDVTEALATLLAQREEVGFATPEDRNPAKGLARRIHGRLPVIVGADVLAEAAHRWATQIHENGKQWAFWQELPELNHNLVEGFDRPPELLERLFVVFLAHPQLHPRVRLRYDVTRELLDAAGVASHTVTARGSGPLAQALSAIHFGDYVSFYLAILNGVNPSPVPRIDVLKRRLSEV